MRKMDFAVCMLKLATKISYTELSTKYFEDKKGRSDFR